METLENLLQYCSENNRACPMPQCWSKLYDILINKRQLPGGKREPSLPLILAAWWDTPTLMKQLRLREHIEWAAKNGQLEEVGKYIRNLQEEEWFHYGD